MTEQICSGQESVTANRKGNTFVFFLDGGSVNITINEASEGGYRLYRNSLGSFGWSMRAIANTDE